MSSHFRLFIFVSLLFINSLWAAAPCVPPKNSVIDSIQIITPDGSCSVALDMAQRLTQISTDLKRPIQLSMEITAANNNAGYDGNHTIFIPSQYVYQTPFHQITAMGTVVQLEVIVVHEFGHALLSQYLKNKYPNGVDKKLDLTFLSYSELFADTVAVYTYKEPSAILKALYFDELDQREYTLLQLRDFGRNHRLDAKELEYDTHLRFAPVRSFIGKYMMPKNKIEKQHYIELLIESIVTVATREALRTTPLSALEANTELISLLETKLH